MSAIGDYIHYTAYGYNIYGINYPGTVNQGDDDKKAVLADAFNSNHKKIIDSTKFLSNAEKNDLERKLSMFSKGANGDVQQEQLDFIWQVVVEELEEQFNACKEEISRDTLNVVRGQGRKTVNASKVRKRKNQTQMLTSTLIKRINAINNAIKNLGLSQTTLNKIKEHMDDLYKNIDQLEYIAKDALSSSQYTELIQRGEEINKKIRLNDPANKAIEHINAMIGLINGSPSMQKGMLLQGLIAVAPYVGANVIKENLKAAIQEAFTENTSSVTLCSGLFSKELNPSDFLPDEYKGNGNIFATVKESPDKVDVTISYNGRPVPISAKNISFDFNISSPYVNLVNGSPLLPLLALTMSGDYINHYLNIVTAHRGGKVGDNSKKEGEVYIRGELLSSIKSSIRLSLLISAFKGYKPNAKGGTAQVFVVNNNTKGRVKIYNIDELLRRALENQKYLNHNYVKIQGNGTQIENLRFGRNNWSGSRPSREGAYSRINALLTQVHGTKISVAINKIAFLHQAM